MDTFVVAVMNQDEDETSEVEIGTVLIKVWC